MADGVSMLHNLTQLWELVVQRVSQGTQNANLAIFLSGSRPIALHEGTLLVEFPNKFFRDWVETRHLSELYETVHHLCGEAIALQLVVDSELNGGTVPAASHPDTRV